MTTDRSGKNRKKWLLTGLLLVLLLFASAAPVLFLYSYTRNDPFWDRFIAGADREDMASETKPALEPYIVQYVYRYCEHRELFEAGAVPESYPVPPGPAAEVAESLYKSNLSIENLVNYVNVPAGWYLDVARYGAERPLFLLTYLADLCPECSTRHFLGVFNERIAVYQGCPPRGKLMEVTEYEIKDIFRQELEEGVPFESIEEKNARLEGYTS